MELLAILILWPVFSIAVAHYAANRGHNPVVAFAGSILLSPLVVWVIEALTPVSREGLLKSGKAQECPQCAELIQPEANRCRYCGYDLAATAIPSPHHPGALI